MKILATSFSQIGKNLNVRLDFRFQQYVDKPISYSWRRFKEVVISIQNGEDISKDYYLNDNSSDLVYPTVNNISKIGFDFDNLIYLDESLSGTKTLKDRDLIIGRSGTVGVSRVWNSKEVKGILGRSVGAIPSGYLIVVSVNDQVNPKFAEYFLNSELMKEYFDVFGVGKTQRNISQPDILNIPFPSMLRKKQDDLVNEIQPIETQITALQGKLVDPRSIIDPAISKVLNIDLGDVKQLESTKAFPLSLSGVSTRDSYRFSFHYQKYSQLISFFGDPNLWQPMPKVFSVNGGKRVPKGVGFSPEETEFRYLRPNEVSFSDINGEEMPFLHERTYTRLKRYKINSGDFAISIVGTLGKIALVNLEELEVEDDCLILSENFAKLSPLIEINRQFYYYFFHSLLFQAQMEREYTIHTQKKLGLDKLANFVVPNLTSGKQEKIVTAIETELSKQEEIKTQIEKKRHEIDKIIEATLN